MILLGSSFRLAPNATFRSLGEGRGGVLVRTDNGYLFTCNDTTCAFIEAMDGRRSIADIAGLMLESFEINRATLEAALVAVADQLTKHGLVSEDRSHS